MSHAFAISYCRLRSIQIVKWFFYSHWKSIIIIMISIRTETCFNLIPTTVCFRFVLNRLGGMAWRYPIVYVYTVHFKWIYLCVECHIISVILSNWTGSRSISDIATALDIVASAILNSQKCPEYERHSISESSHSNAVNSLANAILHICNDYTNYEISKMASGR